MATVTGFTAERMLEIENTTIVDGEVVGNDLILTTREGTPINAGNVRGPTGPTGPTGPVASINDQTGATYAPRIFASKTALDLWVTAPRGAMAITTDTDTLWEKGATVWFPSTGPRVFASTTDLTTNWANAVEGSVANTIDSDVSWFKSSGGWNLESGPRVFATVAERDTRWPAPPQGAMAITIDTNTLWQFTVSKGWQKPWTLPWGTLFKTEYTGISGTISNTAVPIPGYSLFVNSPGNRLIELQSNLSFWNTGGTNCEVVAEYRLASGGPGLGQAATGSIGNLTTQLQVRAVYVPPVSVNVQYDLYIWVQGGSGPLYAAAGRPAISTTADLGPG